MLDQDKKDLSKIHGMMRQRLLDIVYLWMPENEYGAYDGEVIELDPYKHLIITFLHEYLHHLYPKDRDTLIDKRAFRIYNAMSKRQRRYLYQKLELLAERKYRRVK